MTRYTQTRAAPPAHLFPAAVAAQLASGTPVPDDQALKDVLALIEALQRARLLVVS